MRSVEDLDYSPKIRVRSFNPTHKRISTNKRISTMIRMVCKYEVLRVLLRVYARISPRHTRSEVDAPRYAVAFLFRDDSYIAISTGEVSRNVKTAREILVYISRRKSIQSLLPASKIPHDHIDHRVSLDAKCNSHRLK